MRVRIRTFQNAAAPVLVCEHGGRTQTLTLGEARAILDANPEAAGTDAYDELAFSLGFASL